MALAILLVSCATSRPRTETKGERLYKTRCTDCHRLIAPEMYTQEEWNKFLEKYGEKANLTDEDKEQIADYLKKNSKEDKK